MGKEKQRKYILCSRVCSEKEYNRVILKDKYKTSQSIQKYYRVLCDGFVRNGVSIKAFTVRPTDKIASGKRYLPSKNEKDKGVDYHYARSINVSVVDRIYAFLATFFWFINPTNCSRHDRIIFDPLCINQGLGCFIACKLRGLKIVAYVTDLPKIYASPDKQSPLFRKLSYWMQINADGDVFVTEQMNTVSNPKRRPYIVIEGFADQGMDKTENRIEDKYQNRVVLYSGGLRSQYGLDMLVKGFIEANIKNSELHIYGDGDYAKDIKVFAGQDKRIRYFGIRENAVVVAAQIKATLLVNPRYTEAEYTKYSFPGKNIEYMISGTPTLTTVLPGMPKDYCPYVYLLEKETTEGMTEKLRELLSLPVDVLRAFGQRTKDWMLANKNNKMQVAKIIAFLNDF